MSADIGVVVPWGKKSDLNRCLQSIIFQNHPICEIVVIGNSSVSRRDMDSYKKMFCDKRIRFIYLPSCFNANVARNLGMAYLKTSFIAFLDSDDWWDENHIGDTLASLEVSEADMVYSGMRVHSQNGIVERPATDYRTVGSMENYCLSYMPAPTGSFLCCREAALDIMWDNSLHRHQDYDFKARFSKKYRVAHKDSVSVNVDWSLRTPHKYYKDCFDLLASWRPVLRKDLYLRHYVNLFRGAVQDRDCVWIRKLAGFIIARILIVTKRVWAPR